MKEDRSLIKFLLLNIITAGIYGLIFWNRYAADMNTVCMGDGRNTRKVLGRILLTIITSGIYELVWLYRAGDRIAANCRAKGIPAKATGGSVLLWYTVGALLFGIGPLVAVNKLIRGLNDLSAAYNRRAGRGAGATVNVNIVTNAA
ncbi:MAG: DUF4234 domain-containing protein [Clostridia bacterium]|nr:DUF4234 domain-containing protein [Clostridia bacterium]